MSVAHGEYDGDDLIIDALKIVANKIIDLYDKENNDTSIISMDLAGCVYKLFRKTKLGED